MGSESFIFNEFSDLTQFLQPLDWTTQRGNYGIYDNQGRVIRQAFPRVCFLDAKAYQGGCKSLRTAPAYG
jgi:hypothetical protein